jgi:hypothetical protein
MLLIYCLRRAISCVVSHVTYIWYHIYGTLCACIASKILYCMGYRMCHISCDIPQCDCTCSMMLQWFTYIVLLLRYYSCST